MKVCPTCQSRYTDDTLLYCLQDGSALVSDESQNPAPTVAYTGELETVVKNRQADTSSHSQEPQTHVQQMGGTAEYQTQPKTSNTALILIIALLAMILVFGAIGIGAWLYFSKGKPETVDININPPENKKTNTNVNSAAFPSPNVSKTPFEEKPPTPNVNPEEVKREVANTINSWKSLAESRNLSAYMNNYADTIDYYNKKGASISTVRADKQRAFTIYDTLEINLSNIRVTPDASGETATAVFDKEWYFEGDANSSEGKVQTQLRLRKIGGAWKITSEKDLKVYYTN
jgi:hypothetical protein